jgi:hypothetical protein
MPKETPRRHARARSAGVAIALAAALPPPVPPGERVRKEMARAVVEYQAGELTASEAEAFAELADRGVGDVASLLSAGLPAWARGPSRVRFVVSSRVPISRTRDSVVYLPLERVRSRTAPYLHETVHALVPARGDRTWLSEGLACYLESHVSETLGGYDAQVFTRAGNRGIDDAARRTLAAENGRAVLPWVGGRGDPPRLEEDRAGVARPFYVLSQSLTKHLVESVGLEAVVRILVSGRDDAFQSATRRSDEDWRREWLARIG